jgi:alkanesulfonate monooxygenase SsuD/methylene tetrahydromethanopterin reductase-like flavin-dependent oxidoreductase (luciferase family)
MIKFGVQIPQEGVNFSAVLDHARAAERLGYDSVWIPDHLRVVAVPPGSPCYEAWTVLTGVLLGTERVLGGPMVACEAFRNPAWLANAAATLDHMSDGRLILGIGAGWYEGEYRAYGYPWASGAERVERLGEALEIITRFWNGSGEGFEGRFYRAEGTADSPRPLQQPHPPIWVGGQGPKLLRLVARYGDAWNAPVLSPEQVAERVEVLRKLCESEDRPMVEVTYEGPVWIDQDGERIRARLERNAAAENPTQRTYARTAIAGTPPDVVTRIREYVDAGVTHVVCHFGRTTDLRGTELFAREVMPAFGA